MTEEVTAAELVAAALNRAGVPSDTGKPWTEDMVADIYERMSPLTRALSANPEFRAAFAPMVNGIWPEVEKEATRRGLKPKPKH